MYILLRRKSLEAWYIHTYSITYFQYISNVTGKREAQQNVCHECLLQMLNLPIRGGS